MEEEGGYGYGARASSSSSSSSSSSYATLAKGPPLRLYVSSAASAVRDHGVDGETLAALLNVRKSDSDFRTRLLDAAAAARDADAAAACSTRAGANQGAWMCLASSAARAGT